MFLKDSYEIAVYLQMLKKFFYLCSISESLLEARQKLHLRVVLEER